jgi:hypothetical protein
MYGRFASFLRHLIDSILFDRRGGCCKESVKELPRLWARRRTVFPVTLEWTE